MKLMIKHKRVRFVFLLIISVTLVACALGTPRYWPEKTSRVLELGTNKPLSNVMVVASWVGATGIYETRSTCYHVEATKTNEKGEFTIPVYTEGFSIRDHRSINLVFYSPKHKEAYQQKIGPYYKHDDYYLEKFTGTDKERFNYLTNRGRPPSCNDGGKSRRNAFEVHKAIYEEAKSLAKTQGQQDDVKWLRKRMAVTLDENIVTLADEELDKRVDEVLREQEK